MADKSSFYRERAKALEKRLGSCVQEDPLKIG